MFRSHRKDHTNYLDAFGISPKSRPSRVLSFTIAALAPYTFWVLGVPRLAPLKAHFQHAPVFSDPAPHVRDHFGFSLAASNTLSSVWLAL